MNRFAIDNNHRELIGLLAWLFVSIGLADTISDARNATDRRERALRGMAEPMTLSRRLHKLIAALLKPVESATRRLIIALAATLPPPRLKPSETVVPHDTADPPPRADGAGLAPETPPPNPRFGLHDSARFKCFLRYASEPVVPFDRSRFGADPDAGFAPVTDRHLMRRIAALAFALDDLEAHARRFARWRARSKLGLTSRKSPLRPIAPGSPPPSRRKSAWKPEHHILAETDSLARYALNYGFIDTS